MIKFRNWDINNQTMSTTYRIDKEMELNDLFQNKEYIFMRNTGFLNSARNQEVYEGDILRVTEFDFSDGLKMGELDGAIGEVRFFMGSFNITLGHCIYPLKRFSFNMQAERLLVNILGNKYENPEIVEKYNKANKKKLDKIYSKGIKRIVER